MRIEDSLNIAVKKFKKAKILSADLDAEVLLAFALKKPKEYLYAHPETVLTARQDEIYRKLIARRAKHEPVAYLTGHREFFGLDFVVNQNVLIPRPETELMVEEAIKLAKTSPRPLLIDIGTGSGCIPIAIVKNIKIDAVAIDTSSVALKIARQNARKNGLDKKIKFIKGDLLSNLKFKIKNSKFLIITANLPYLPTAEWRGAPPDVKKYEPRLALDGGRDGLKYYRQLLPQIALLAKNIPKTKMICLFEFCPEQKTALKKLALKYFPNAKVEISPSPDKSGESGRAFYETSRLRRQMHQSSSARQKIGGPTDIIIKKDLAKRDRLMLLKV